MQNLRYYSRQRIEALTNNVKVAVYQVMFEHIVQIKPHDSLSDLVKWKNLMSKNHYTCFSAIWIFLLNSVNLWNWRFSKVLCNTSYYLIIASS